MPGGAKAFSQKARNSRRLSVEFLLQAVTPKKVCGEVGITTIALEDTADLERGVRRIREYDPGIIVSSLGRTHSFGEEEVRRHFKRLNEFATTGNT